MKSDVSALKRRLSLKSQSWFHGQLSRQEAEAMLRKEGDFLIRESLKKKTNEIQYVLSVLWQNFRHILIVQDEEVMQNMYSLLLKFELSYCFSFCTFISGKNYIRGPP